MPVVVPVGGAGAVERGIDVTGSVAEDGLEDDTGPVVEFADDLVSGDEREAHPVLEVGRGCSTDE